jgi:hypothetical protein
MNGNLKQRWMEKGGQHFNAISQRGGRRLRKQIKVAQVNLV